MVKCTNTLYSNNQGRIQGGLWGISPPGPVKSILGGFQAPTGAEPPPKTNFWIRPWTNATAAETQSCLWRSQIEAEF